MEILTQALGHGLIILATFFGVFAFAVWGIEKILKWAGGRKSKTPTLAKPLGAMALGFGLYALGGFIDSLSDGNNSYVAPLVISTVCLLAAILLLGRILERHKREQ